MQKIKVSVIIVYYKEKEKLLDCLESIRNASIKVPYEIIVVDNDRKKILGPILEKRFPQTVYVSSPGNIGYGAGNNLGAKRARGEYLLILNPDTRVLPHSLNKLVDFLVNNRKVGIVAPNLVNEKLEILTQLGSSELTPMRGIVALSFLNKLFPSNPISKKYWLSDVPKDKKREVDVVPGAAFMMRKSLFDQIGGFDENFFLYFEESDLGKRAKATGAKIFIIPEAQVVHRWRERDSRDERTNRIFSQSRFYYFKKHYGIFRAAFVEVFTRFSKWYALSLFAFVSGAFLRFYRLPENLVFHGELGHNYLAIKNAFETQTIPLLGPPTSHPWLAFGPLFYWLFGPILAFFGFNPVVGSSFFALTGTILIALNFWTIKKFFGDKAAAISSFLIAVSPAWMMLTREARFFSLTTFFFYPFFYVLLSGRLFLAGFFLGMMFNFHLSPIILIPGILMTICTLKGCSFQGALGKLMAGFLIPNLPFLIDDASRKFEMLRNLFVWFPYRIAGFVGLYPKNTISIEIFKDNVFSFYQFVGRMFAIDNTIISLAVLAIILFFLCNRHKNRSIYPLILFFVFGYLGIFIHGDPPSHYYLPLYPLPLIFFSLFLAEAGSRWQELVTLIILVGLLILNLKFYFSDKWFYLPQDRISEGLSVPYQMQLGASRSIIADAKGREFILARVGPYDYFEGRYAQNYQYLLWWMGNEPVETGKLRYTIYEDVSKLPIDPKGEIFRLDGLAVLKEKP